VKAEGNGMISSRNRTILSYLTITGGAVLLFLGARDFIAWRMDQADVAYDFGSSLAVTQAKSPTSKPVQLPQPGDAFAKLVIPRLDAQLFVVEGDGARELRRGPGHLTGTALPGSHGNCVIAGHRDTHFRVLKDIRKGDDIVLETPNGEYLYRVKSTRIVSPQDLTALQPTSGPHLNLITCYPFFYVGSAPKRFVVEAQLAGTVSSVPGPS
jgi:sortase A